MNTVLSTRVDEQNQKHPPATPRREADTCRVTLIDRVALRLGLALITWSRRPRAVASRPGRDELRARHSLAVERAARERRAERALRLTLPPR